MQPVITTPTALSPLPTELDHAAFNKTEDFAAQLLGAHRETLRGWRKRGVGPQFKKVGGKLVRYSIASLMAFMQAQPGGGKAA
jgi:hypothetical protein